MKIPPPFSGSLRGVPPWSAAAFTLVEIMVAMSVFVLLLGGVVVANLCGLKMLVISTTKLTATEAARKAIGKLTDEIRASKSVYVGNVADELLPSGGEGAMKVIGIANEEGAPAMVLSARLEAELTELDPAEEKEMRASYGIDESGLGRIARAVWEAGGLITYFTAGEPEVRAWPCERDSAAPQAAAKIHTDFEKHFIRAEVTSVDELVAAGSMDALRAAGKLRVEGRDYRVQDGDVVFFRVGR